MKNSMRAILMAVLFAGTVGILPCGPLTKLQACPGCKNANETDNLRPRAYMYSILFMLGMPATVFSGFGIAFYRLSRRAALEQEALLRDSEDA